LPYQPLKFRFIQVIDIINFQINNFTTDIHTIHYKKINACNSSSEILIDDKIKISLGKYA